MEELTRGALGGRCWEVDTLAGTRSPPWEGCWPGGAFGTLGRLLMQGCGEGAGGESLLALVAVGALALVDGLAAPCAGWAPGLARPPSW